MSLYIAGRRYQFCWQYAIILVWKTCVKSVKLLNVWAVKYNGTLTIVEVLWP